MLRIMVRFALCAMTLLLAGAAATSSALAANKVITVRASSKHGSTFVFTKHRAGTNGLVSAKLKVSRTTYVVKTANVASRLSRGVLHLARRGNHYSATLQRLRGTVRRRPAATLRLTYDTTPPQTTVTPDLARPTNSNRATFALSSSESRSTFDCRLDSERWSACKARATFANLPVGTHAFQARATDRYGNTDRTPASSSWKVTTSAPVIPTPVVPFTPPTPPTPVTPPGPNPTPDVGPSAPTGVTAVAPGDGTATLSWSPSPGTVAGYSVLTGGRMVTATTGTSVKLTGLTNGQTYTYTVRAHDGVGGVSTPSAPVTAKPPGGGTTPGTTLVWSDEFDGTAGASPSASRWTRIDWCDNWGSLSCNTARPRNVQTTGTGLLKISALRENYTDPYGSKGTYTTARIISTYKFLRGRLRARVLLPTGRGLWPAFWGTTDKNGNQTSGEYDLLETLGDDPGRDYCSIHGWQGDGAHLFGLTASLRGVSSGAGAWHVYEMLWSPATITYKIDGQFCFTFTTSFPGAKPWPFTKPGNIMFNLAVGGGWPGNPDQTTAFPANMYVDWVRVYQ